MNLIDIEISNVRVHEKGALRGFFTLMVMGLKIIDCRYFVSGDRRWFCFPQKEIKKPEGEKTEYIPYISILNRDFKKTFEDIVLDKLAQADKGVPAHEVQAHKRPTNSVQADTSPLPF